MAIPAPAAIRSHPRGFFGRRDAITAPISGRPRFASSSTTSAPVCRNPAASSDWGVTKNRTRSATIAATARPQIVHASRPAVRSLIAPPVYPVSPDDSRRFAVPGVGGWPVEPRAGTTRSLWCWHPCGTVVDAGSFGAAAGPTVEPRTKEATDDHHPGRNRHLGRGRPRGRGRGPDRARARRGAARALRPPRVRSQGGREPGSRSRPVRVPRGDPHTVPLGGDPHAGGERRPRRAHLRRRRRGRRGDDRHRQSRRARRDGGVSATACRTSCSVIRRARCTSWTRGGRSDVRRRRSRGGTPAPPSRGGARPAPR